MYGLTDDRSIKTEISFFSKMQDGGGAFEKVSRVREMVALSDAEIAAIFDECMNFLMGRSDSYLKEKGGAFFSEKIENFLETSRDKIAAWLLRDKEKVKTQPKAKW